MRATIRAEACRRLDWIGWQSAVLSRHPQFEAVVPEAGARLPHPRARLRPDVTPDDLRFGPLGYADAALASYAVFARLKQDGAIPTHLRFPVCLPSPLAPVLGFVVPEHTRSVLPAYERRLLEELDEIAASIPHAQLAIQWDVAVEFTIWEGLRAVPDLGETKLDALERLGRVGNRVPADVDLGYHLCYGDYGHRHFEQPRDTSNLVEVANGLAERVGRTIEWRHVPVPRERDDPAYFLPLRELTFGRNTSMYLGLIHLTDGVPGAVRRIAAARTSVPDFGVATQCGLGRRDPASIPELLQLHTAVADRIPVEDDYVVFTEVMRPRPAYGAEPKEPGTYDRVVPRVMREGRCPTALSENLSAKVWHQTRAAAAHTRMAPVTNIILCQLLAAPGRPRSGGPVLSLCSMPSVGRLVLRKRHALGDLL
jgi:hypothetical protein